MTEKKELKQSKGDLVIRFFSSVFSLGLKGFLLIDF